MSELKKACFKIMCFAVINGIITGIVILAIYTIKRL